MKLFSLGVFDDDILIKFKNLFFVDDRLLQFFMV